MASKGLTLTARAAVADAFAFLNAYGELFGQAKRRYLRLLRTPGFASLSRKQQKLRVCGHDLAYRQYKGVEETIKGLLASRDTNHKNHRVEQQHRIDRAKARVQKATDKVNLLSRLPSSDDQRRQLAKAREKRYQQQRGLNVQRDRLAKLKAATAHPVCLGSKALLRTRAQLDADYLANLENVPLPPVKAIVDGYRAALADWRQRWAAARSDEIFLVGVGSETAGNPVCQLIPGNGTQPDRLRVRVPPSLEGQFGTWQIIPVKLPVYREAILAAQRDNKPLTYRFKRRAGIWQMLVTFAFQTRGLLSDRQRGAIGVDFNVDHFAVCRVDGKGNYCQRWRFPLAVRGRTSNQRADSLLKAIAAIVGLAERYGIPVVIEQLDFARKKRALAKSQPAMARLLSAFATSKVKQGFTSRCGRRGVELIAVNAAWTSQLGALKYADRYGLTTHQAAAMVIARRGLGYSETAPQYQLRLHHANVSLLTRQALVAFRTRKQQSMIANGLDSLNETVMQSTKRALIACHESVLVGKDQPVAASLLPPSWRMSRQRLSHVLNRGVQSPQLRAQYWELLATPPIVRNIALLPDDQVLTHC